MDPELLKVKEAGRQLAPFLLFYGALELAKTRNIQHAIDRQKILLECVQDARFLLDAVLGDGTTR